jgi:hypothetical protein
MLRAGGCISWHASIPASTRIGRRATAHMPASFGTVPMRVRAWGDTIGVLQPPLLELGAGRVHGVQHKDEGDD